MNSRNSIVRKLADLKKRYRNQVEIEFLRGNLDKGNDNLRKWTIDFLKFLNVNYPEHAKRFSIKVVGKSIKRNKTGSSINLLRAHVGKEIESLIDSLISDPVQRKDLEEKAIKAEIIKSKKSSNVFVVLGRNRRVNDSMYEFLATLGLNPLDFAQAILLTGNPAADIPEILDAAFKNAQAVIVLMTPDEISLLRNSFTKADDTEFDKSPYGQPRPNVLFEAGMAMASHTGRTILVTLGKVRPFTDISGIHIVRLDNSVEKREELIERLRLCKCKFRKPKNRIYLRVGNFKEKNLMWENEVEQIYKKRK